MEITEYIKQINEQFRTGQAREHSYRPMLQQLLSDMLKGFIVTNEPSRCECGAPDFIVTDKNTQMPVFFLEAKDINDNDLDGHSKNKEQFTRYKKGLDHIIFTNYLEFHFYENQEWKDTIQLAEVQGDNIHLCTENVERFKELISHFAAIKPKKITSASKLAQQMAAKARILASIINKAFERAEISDEARDENEQLQMQLEAFQEVLIKDLSAKAFADIYAQTVAYGMFAARLHDTTPDDFSRQEAATLIPKTNPFLRQIFDDIAGTNLDERITWIVDDLAGIFQNTDIKKVMKNYSNSGLHNDPMIHFYEEFLSAYNPEERKKKGVWYTPQPVVQFIVRAVDQILQRDFDLADGLADYSMITHEVINEQYHKGEKYKGKQVGQPTIKKQMHRVQILDPATGTGTFLAETVNQIYDKFHNMQGVWQGYVSDHLLPRLHGFELLMASYAVAHLKLDMLLQQTGFDFTANKKRLKIYLTNSLEEFHDNTGTMWSAWLSKEANEASRIKRDCPVMVMMGNPPYSVSSSNKGEWITKLLEDYKEGLNEKNIQPLSDDYIKFIRLAQDYVTRNGEGIMAYISNNSFIDGVIHREMRRQLLLAYDDIYILNLHGNTRKKEKTPDGSKDDNVFDIMQGVSINIFVRRHDHQEGNLGKVYYKDLFGSRNSKYDYLTNTDIDTVNWEEIKYREPEYFFVPMDLTKKDEYNRNIDISSLFVDNACGIVSSRDDLLIKSSVEKCEEVRKDFNELSEYDFRQKYNIKDSRDWTYGQAKADIIKASIIPLYYRPFDSQFVPYTPKAKGVLSYPRYKIMQHIQKENIGLYVTSKNRQLSTMYFAVVAGTVDKHYLDTSSDSAYLFPLYLYKENYGTEEKLPNLNPDEWKRFNDAVGRDTTPEELLAYIYAVLHSPSYRKRYKEFLKVDFPRIPLPESEEYFNRMAQLGQQLIDLHLMKNASNWKCDITFPESGTGMVEQYKWKDGNVWINDSQYFGNVPEDAWKFFIGGYQPAQKWLKDRTGRILSYNDAMHYIHIIHALTETERLIQEIG